MGDGSKGKLDKIITEIRDSRIFQRLKRHYKIKIFPGGDGLVAQIQLRDGCGELVDVLAVQANSEGLVGVLSTLELIATTWAVALDDPLWRAGSARIRNMMWPG